MRITGSRRSADYTGSETVAQVAGFGSVPKKEIAWFQAIAKSRESADPEAQKVWRRLLAEQAARIGVKFFDAEAYRADQAKKAAKKSIKSKENQQCKS